ncbi:DUF1707 domain-containing protein [Kutzneria viridogrisea]|uniref:DUF1707 domain-containing protein n=1 Tax=Kutzneria viridogrisea TaxID=47990 RepID=A0ABR6BN50_9PSEU|nr:hypothetical protein [Kutzneria viridogrisea]
MVRLSNEDRERCVELLNRAVADGRLTWTEHAERVETVYAARMAEELAPVLSDLGQSGVPALPDQGEHEVAALFSKIVRVPDLSRRITVRAVFGAVVLNLAAARPGERIEVEASSFCGKVVLLVPPGAQVIDEGAAVLGKRALMNGGGSPDGPLIRVTGTTKLGNLKVYG